MSSFNSTRSEVGGYCFQQPRGVRERRLHTHTSALQSIMFNRSHVRSFERSHFPSPAKVFAKLKASVGRNTGGTQTYEKDGSVLLTKRKEAANTQETKLMTNETSCFDPLGAEAMTISPTKSAHHKPPKFFPHCTKYKVPSPIRDTRQGLIERNEYTTVKIPDQVTQQVPLSHKAPPLRSSKYVFRPPAIGQPQQLIKYESGGRPIIDNWAKEATVCLAKCPSMSPAKMCAYFKRSERKHALLFPQKTAHGKKDVHTELSDDESQSFSPAKPSESDVSSGDDPTNYPWLHDSEKALVSKRTERFESCRKDDSPISAHTTLLVLAEDPLVNQSPCVSIRLKHNPILKRKPAPLEPIQPKQIPVQKGSVFELARWTIKYSREGLYVDGIRTSDNTPWHSTVIVKRISGDVIRTLSGKTYTLIGPMDMYESSKFPMWLLRKFANGFPPEWKKHFKRFLLESKKDAVSSSAAIFPQGPRHRGQGLGPGATKNAKKQSSSPFVTPSCPPPSSGGSSLALKKSRSGRLIKPPLKFWKGGRVIMDQSMNVTILEDYYENSVCMTKSSTLPTILEPQPPKLHGGLPQRRRQATLPSQGTGRPLVDQRQSSSPTVLRRKAKAAGRNRKAKTHAASEASASPLEEEGPGQDAGSSSPEEQEPRARGGTALQAGPSARRPDPSQRSDYDAPEGRVALPRVKKIPLAHGAPASSSDEDIPGRIKAGRQGMYQSVQNSLSSTSLSSMDASWTLGEDRRKTVTRRNKGKGRARSPEIAPAPLSAPAQPSKRGGRRAVAKEVSAPAQPAVSAPAQPSKRGGSGTVAQPSKRGGSGTVPKRGGSGTVPKRGGSGTVPKRGVLQEEIEDWTEAELTRLKRAIASFPKHVGSYWGNVSMMVGTRSPEDCQTRHFQESVKASSKNARVPGKKMDPPADQAPPAITARTGTLMRKRQMRQFLEAMPEEDNDDVFSSKAMQGKRFKMPSMSPSGKEQGFVLSDLEPTTPRGSSYCTAKTPSGLHISPGMIRSLNRKKDDNYIYQLQKRMKRNQVNACKLGPPTKSFPLTPSVKRGIRKGENIEDTSFVIREMFPDNQGAQDDDSGEEQDDYFSDSD